MDIDPQAVEVSKLSLLMKVLEGETDESVANQLRLFHERALPDLGRNVKCGNSLVAWDFLRGEGAAKLDPGTRDRVNPFDWRTEFSEVFERETPGFDAVVGNPPYVFGEYLDASSKSYFRSTYSVASGQYDAYWLFIERSLTLLRSGGRFSMVLPDAVLARDEAISPRDLLLKKGVTRFYHCGLVFAAAVSAVVITVEEGSKGVRIPVDIRVGRTSVQRHTCDRTRFERDPFHRFLIHASDDENRILKQLGEASDSLGELPARVSRGEELGKRGRKAGDAIPILVGEDVGRFEIRTPSRYVPEMAKDPATYAAPKVVLVKTGAGCITALDLIGYVTMQSVYNIHLLDSRLDARVLVGILNSTVINFYLLKTFTAYKLLFPQLNQTTVERLPIPKKAASAGHRLSQLVEQAIALRITLRRVETADEKQRLARNIDALGIAIDEEVAHLYGLSDADLRVINTGREVQARVSAAARQRLDGLSGLLTASQTATDAILTGRG